MHQIQKDLNQSTSIASSKLAKKAGTEKEINLYLTNIYSQVSVSKPFWKLHQLTKIYQNLLYKVFQRIILPSCKPGQHVKAVFFLTIYLMFYAQKQEKQRKMGEILYTFSAKKIKPKNKYYMNI